MVIQERRHKEHIDPPLYTLDSDYESTLKYCYQTVVNVSLVVRGGSQAA
jgi:hypothetical protein